jgi:hypothetical protein
MMDSAAGAGGCQAMLLESSLGVPKKWLLDTRWQHRRRSWWGTLWCQLELVHCQQWSSGAAGLAYHAAMSMVSRRCSTGRGCYCKMCCRASVAGGWCWSESRPGQAPDLPGELWRSWTFRGEWGASCGCAWAGFILLRGAVLRSERWHCSPTLVRERSPCLLWGEVVSSLTKPAHALLAERCDLFDRDETVIYLSVLSVGDVADSMQISHPRNGWPWKAHSVLLRLPVGHG